MLAEARAWFAEIAKEVYPTISQYAEVKKEAKENEMQRMLNSFARLLTLVLLTLTFGSAVAADKTVYYHTDAVGSVVAATDEQGELLWRESYKPFGDRMDRQVSTNDNPVFFTGKPHDDTTGLSYFGARYYDPEIGRFTGIDPAGVDLGNIYSFGRYSYANNNPYKFVDPDGREVISSNPANNATIGKYINTRARGVFKFDKNNKLQMVRSSGSGGYAKYYRDRLKAGIASKDPIEIGISSTFTEPTGKTWNIDKQAGGGLTYGRRSGGPQKVIISGNPCKKIFDVKGNPLRDDPADILMHEMVGHAIPHVAGSDTGNAVKNENKVRSQITGGGKRRAEPWHGE